jgi:myo-inositol-1(or 4)-monophosphatase
MKTEFLETAKEAARAGAAVLEEWADKFTVSEKSPANLVTEADFASQQAIHKIIAARFPDHGFLGEEDCDTSQGFQKIPGMSGSGYRWIVDPLDGTSNYVHRFPFYAVSIGLEHDGELVVGVVLDPNRNELFSAVRGGGAFLNDRPIRPTKTDRLDQALVVASLPVNVGRDHFAIRQFLAVLTASQHLQRTGSAALNLCYVACGRIDAYFSSSLKAWDMAAGAVIVREAGGRVTNMEADSLDVFHPEILSSNGTAVHEALGEICRTARDASL